MKKDTIEIAKELIAKNHDIDLCIDTMFMNKCGMLTTIDKTVKFRSLVPMKTKQDKEYYRALDAILRHYNQAGFVIKTIHCDGEYKAMNELSSKITRQGASFAQQHLLHKGLKVFGRKGHEDLAKEINQLYRRNCFSPISVASMTIRERRKVMTALMFLTEKRDPTIKRRMVYNGKPTREWLSREDSASPTAALESIMLTAVIEAHEGRDVMTVDIPNAFIQTEMPEREEGEERVIVKITGVLVKMMVQLDPDKYRPCVVFEKGKKVVYVQVL